MGRVLWNVLVAGICSFFWDSSYGQSVVIQSPVKYLALGDSYTTGHNVAANEGWPIQFMAALRAQGIPGDDVHIIAKAGWRTDQLRSAILKEDLAKEASFSLVSLLIGTNNVFQRLRTKTYSSDFEDLLRVAIHLAGQRPRRVMVLSLPDYGYTPSNQNDQQGISDRINSFNDINRKICADYGVPYIDITDISRRGLNEPDLVAADGFHPSGKQYALWVKRILENAIFRTDIGDSDDIVTEVKRTEVPMSVSPNPFEDRLAINIGSGMGHHFIFRLQDITGRLVLERTFVNDKIDVSFESEKLEPGLYIYHIISDQQVYKGKVIKNK